MGTQKVHMQRMREVSLEVRHRGEVHADQPSRSHGCRRSTTEIAMKGGSLRVRMLGHELMKVRLERLPKARVEIRLQPDIDNVTNWLGPGSVSGAHGPILH